MTLGKFIKKIMLSSREIQFGEKSYISDFEDTKDFI